MTAWVGRRRRPSRSRGGRLAWVLAVGVSALALWGMAGQDTSAASRAAGSPPAAAPRDPVSFQPGVRIDWQRLEVQVEARVVLRSGALEFLACWPGKEHESIVRCEAAAAHVYMALGLIGLMPGHPPIWEAQIGEYGAPAGDLVDISFRWEEDGRTGTADAYDWLREVEYGRRPVGRPWVFAGSQRRPDGTLSTEVSGVGVALVDFPDGLICVSRRHASRNAELWVEAETAGIPREGTVVQMILRGAAARVQRVRLDFRGAIWVNDRYCSAVDLADLVGLARQRASGYAQQIDVVGTLESDVRRVQRALAEAGVPEDGLVFVRATAPAGVPRRGG